MDRYAYITCTACESRTQRIDAGAMPTGEAVCGLCLRVSLGLSFAQLRERMAPLRAAREEPPRVMHLIPLADDPPYTAEGTDD